MEEAPDFIPDDQVPPEEPPKQEAPDFIPDSEMAKHEAPDFISDEDLARAESNTSEKIGTVAENVARAAIPGFTSFETAPESSINQYLDMLPDKGVIGAAKLGVKAVKKFIGQASPEEIKAREEKYPELAMASQIAGGTAALFGAPAEALASFGARGLKGGLENMALEGVNEIDKASLGRGDPTPSVAARLAGSFGTGFLIGGVTGMRPTMANAALQKLQASRFGSLLSDFLKGAGQRAKFLPEEMAKIVPHDVKSVPVYALGQKAFDYLHSRAFGAALGAAEGGHEGGFFGSVLGGAGGSLGQVILKKLFGRQLTKLSSKYLAPLILKAASSGVVKNPEHILEHAAAIGRGDNAMTKGVEALFQAGGQKAYEGQISQNEQKKLNEFVESGGPLEQENLSSQQPQGYAAGGQIEPVNNNNEIANHWPEQNTMLSAARGRVHAYLNSVRPLENPIKLPYDHTHKDPHKEREYKQTMHLAAHPLSILNHVKSGSLLPKHMSAFNAMYPELHQELSKRIHKRLVEAQLNKEKEPPHKVRQAMSLFLGTNLDSTLSPQNMMAAQAVFAQQKSQQQAPPTSKNSALGKLGKSSLTPDQARQERQLKS